MDVFLQKIGTDVGENVSVARQPINRYIPEISAYSGDHWSPLQHTEKRIDKPKFENHPKFNPPMPFSAKISCNFPPFVL